MTTPRIVTVPYRGLRCRENACQEPIVLVTTTRGRTMPLEQELVPIPLDRTDDVANAVAVLEIPGVDPSLRAAAADTIAAADTKAENGLFVVVTGSAALASSAFGTDNAAGKLGEPIAVTLRQARELGLIVQGPVYRAHWSGCANADRFRR